MAGRDAAGRQGAAAEVAAALGALGAYRVAVLPQVDRELTALAPFAAAIPDSELRAAAVGSLVEKRANVEAVAVLATTAPRRHRRAVMRAQVALQAAIDYLDTLGERDGTAPWPDGDWCAERPRDDDGGYLEALLDRCRGGVAVLPAGADPLPRARASARRCGEGQSATHSGEDALRRWGRALPAPAELRWWEATAGASSSVAAHALIALAGTPGASVADAERVERAYDPWIGALTVILDDLVDREADEGAGEPSYLRYYEDPAELAARLDLLVRGAREVVTELPPRHGAVLGGVLAYYLGSGRLSRNDDLDRQRLDAAAAPAVRILAGFSRLRRHS